MTAASDEEERWARALAALNSTPPEAPHRQAARERYDARALRLAAVLACTAGVLAPVLLAVDPPPASGDPPAWRVITGVTLGGLGALLALVGPAARPFGSRWGLARPLGVLTPAQRAELSEQVRGRAPVEPERIDLARLEAQRLLDQRSRLLLPTGLVVAFVGMWTVQPSVLQTLMTLAFLTMAAAVAVPVLRDARHARRFLEEHPAPDGG